MLLALATTSTSAQSTTPNSSAHGPVPLEAKPPDEPPSSAAPEANPNPEAAPSAAELPPVSGAQDEKPQPLTAEMAATPPQIETYVVPVYPPDARAKRIEGRVLLIVVIDGSGKVEDDVQVIESIPMLDQAAIDAVHQWKFTPARDDAGNPLEVQMQVGVPFALK